ncbi:MAG: response regulator [Acidobacteriota bacterium]
MDREQTSAKISVLIVEDDEDQAFLEKEKLEQAFPSSKIDVVNNGTDCLRKPLGEYDLIFLDLNLPDIFGLDLLKKIQMTCDIPVIIITGENDISSAVSALKSGASDYVIKSNNAFEVLPIIAQNAIANYQTKKESEILKQRLIQSEKMAAIGKLASGVAHEINNPLTAVLGFTEILLLKSHDGFKSKLEKIRESAMRCKRIVEDLLSFAREHKTEKKLLNVNELLERSLSIGNSLIKMFNIQVQKVFEEPSPCFYGDEFHMQQVFVNIYSNACHAMEHSEKKILTISTGSCNDSIFIRFSDTGHGIPAGILSRIFDPFFTTKEVGKGSGLGLSICYGIIAEHSGKISAESPPGEGATFIIELPKADQLHAHETERTFKEKLDLLNPLAILVVEDEENICDFYRDALEEDKNTIRFARSGKQAFEELEQRNFDIIILDLRIPDINGMQFYNTIKERKPDFLNRILICTGDTISAEVKEFLSKVNSIVLNKPFTLSDLKKSIINILTEQQSLSM